MGAVTAADAGRFVDPDSLLAQGTPSTGSRPVATASAGATAAENARPGSTTIRPQQRGELGSTPAGDHQLDGTVIAIGLFGHLKPLGDAGREDGLEGIALVDLGQKTFRGTGSRHRSRSATSS